MSKAYRKRLVLEDFDRHRIAWLTLVAKSTTGGKNPKYKYRNFNKFFDLKKELAKLDGNESQSEYDELIAFKRRKAGESNG